MQRVPINSQGSSEEIIGTFIQTLRNAMEIADSQGIRVMGIGIDTPGPFDFAKGISLMGRGLGQDKFSSIYGINLRNEFVRRLGLKEGFPIIFEPDSWAFLRGEAWLGAAKGYNRILGITLGTGLGSAFMVNDEIVIRGPGVPGYGWLAQLPYRNGVVEDRISRRGILTRYEELTGKSIRGLDVIDIAKKAMKKDRISLQVFEETGMILGKALSRICSDFRPECLVLGGQISKSFSLFAEPLRNQLRSIPSLKKITQAKWIDLSPLYGVAKLLFKGTVSPAWSLPTELTEEEAKRIFAELSQYAVTD
ncbi:MAG: ROK Family Protein [Candidatus Bathyarchaeota archaeon B63]|nr:MAG: ROK Family Protein [Candidatus Bathyarchaeota archaeon B63]